MPKKTKKQKISAQLRRKNFLITQQKNLENPDKQLQKTSPKNINRPDMTIKIKNTAGEISYFKHDFKKSLIIVSIIIALEIVIYFGTII